jgi:hypothetical protein
MTWKDRLICFGLAGGALAATGASLSGCGVPACNANPDPCCSAPHSKACRDSKADAGASGGSDPGSGGSGANGGAGGAGGGGGG